MALVRVAEWTVEFGGEEATGWLPDGAAKPPATPLQRVDLAFAVLSFGDGDYILEWKGPTDETCGDSAHDSLEDAITSAEEAFGVPIDAWSILAEQGE
jgi:hypothetical protein